MQGLWLPRLYGPTSGYGKLFNLNIFLFQLRNATNLLVCSYTLLALLYPYSSPFSGPASREAPGLPIGLLPPVGLIHDILPLPKRLSSTANTPSHRIPIQHPCRPWSGVRITGDCSHKQYSLSFSPVGILHQTVLSTMSTSRTIYSLILSKLVGSWPIGYGLSRTGACLRNVLSDGTA